MKIYIGASFPKIAKASSLANALRNSHEITSIWHDADAKYDPANSSRAVRDLHQVQQAELVIIYIGDSSSGGGRHCELGIAIGLNKKIILIGEYDNCVFERLPWISRSTTEEVIRGLK